MSDFPSWVPDLGADVELQASHLFLRYILQPEYNFSAAGTNGAEISFSNMGRVLTVKGFKMGSFDLLETNRAWRI